MNPNEKPYTPKAYNLDKELKSQIVYESLCENYTTIVVEGTMKWMSLTKGDLYDDSLVKKLLDVLNGDAK
jgi:hypothetical protein